ncbi:hypothetical protein TNCV_328771 [Trichonephila clavipes]|nr:hypothetical protein TNCV_328771 [Trichonephila clavipes]
MKRFLTFGILTYKTGIFIIVSLAFYNNEYPTKSCYLPHRGGRVFLSGMSEVRWELVPGKATLDAKAIPLWNQQILVPKISRYWSQDRFLPSGALILGSTEAARFMTDPLLILDFLRVNHLIDFV